MRIWTLHPKYLDSRGLVALWREALLAQKVLKNETRGYRNHPQLLRFRSHPDPVAAIATYLQSVFEEALLRGYSFDSRKIERGRVSDRISTTQGQLVYEWEHLKKKLQVRSPEKYQETLRVTRPSPHPLFQVLRGDREYWEKPPQARRQGTAKNA